MRLRRRQPATVALDIAPIVDTVFNLMIFFALSLNFLSMPGIRVNLPKATPDQHLAQSEQITISITKDHEVLLGDSVVNPEELLAALRAEAARPAPRVVVIKADSAALHGEVVQVMNTARRAGLTRLAIAALPLARQAADRN